MQLGYRHLSNVTGLQFHKMLGTGAGNGFSIYPNLGQYAMLSVWDNTQKAEEFFIQSSFQQEYNDKASHRSLYYLRPVHGHGLWDKVEPFYYQAPLEQDSPWAVITRASISKRRMLEFWRHVPSVSKSIEDRPGLKLSIGIGEWPLIQQATFSVWESLNHMKDYAYKSRLHREVVTKTRDRQWYSEELFARFQVLKSV